MKLAKNLGRVLLVVLAAAVATQMVSAHQSKKKEGSVVPDWGQYRGPKRDGISPDTGLLAEWPKGGPTLAWKTTGIGGGYSSVSVAGKFAYTMGEADGSEVIIAITTADGKVAWKAKVTPTGNPDNRGPGPRSTPATDGTIVVGVGHDGTVVCVRAANGQEVWRTSYQKLGANGVPGWGFSDSPLIDGGMVVCIPGGNKGTVAALNKANGALVWQSGEIKDGAHYTSLVSTDLGGIPQYVVFTDKSVAGIVAQTGRVAWKVAREGRTAICSSPVISKDGVVFVSSGYGVGHTAFQLAFSGGQFRIQELYKGKELESHHGGMVLVGNHVYGLSQTSLVCMEPKTGKVAWQERSVGKGSIAYADGHLYVRSEGGAGTIALVEATPTGYKEKGRFDQPDRSRLNSWAHPTVYGGKLYVRDQDVLLCYNVQGK